jgi:arylsulfatase A-like enzyme
MKYLFIGLVLFLVFKNDLNCQNSHVVNYGNDTLHPNVLWIYLEDTNPWMSCYGDGVVQTPNIDHLAQNGVRFDRAYMTSAVCSPTRSALITGMYQTSINAHEHYSSYSVWRGDTMEVWDPNFLSIKTLPEIFRDAGYYTFNEGKTHYNFVFSNDDLYDRKGEVNGFNGAENGSEWSGRKHNQPFFGQIQLRGGKYTNPPVVIEPSEVSVPPYYPDHPVYRSEIANHYNTILKMDQSVREIISKLKEDGLYENTVIFFFSDHGMRLPRHKQFLYEGGIRVPLIVAGSGLPKGHVRSDLVTGIDISATSLALAGIPIPDHMQGKNMFSDYFDREYVITARDRCDFTIDRVRAVVSDRYKYIRNFMTEKPYLQAQYRDGRESMKVLKELYAQGKLNDVQAHFVSNERPAEEFYDLWEDPHETHNLIHSHKHEHALELGKHRDALNRWIIETDDKGRYPESNESLQAVIDRWGDRAVNKEYKRVRETNESAVSGWKNLINEAKSTGKEEWQPMLKYVAELHQKSTHPPQWPFEYPWEEIGPGYTYGPAFGHWDIVHQVIDVMPSYPQHALHQLLNNIENQEPNGLIPGSIWMPGNDRDSAHWSADLQGHPPLWVFAVNDYIDLTRNDSILKHFYSALLRQISWFENNRKAESKGFYYNDILLKLWESGVDEGVRFDDIVGGKLACIDATSHVYYLYKTAVEWSVRLGIEHTYFSKRADELKDFISQELYVEDEGMFYDIWAMDNKALRTMAFENLFPLVVGAINQEQANRLIDDYILNKKHFNAKHPITSVGLSDPKFELRMWRGPAWNSMTYWIARGCIHYGRDDAAKILLEKALDQSAIQFKKTGKIWEFYHPFGKSPVKLDRKPHSSKPNRPCQDYLGHNPLIEMARMYDKIKE